MILRNNEKAFKITLTAVLPIASSNNNQKELESPSLDLYTKIST